MFSVREGFVLEMYDQGQICKITEGHGCPTSELRNRSVCHRPSVTNYFKQLSLLLTQSTVTKKKMKVR